MEIEAHMSVTASNVLEMQSIFHNARLSMQRRYQAHIEANDRNFEHLLQQCIKDIAIKAV